MSAKKKNYRIVTILRPSIKDNAGDVVANALRYIGFNNVKSVRMGKTYYVKCTSEKIKPIAEVLVNAVMEDYRIEKIK